MKLLTRLDKFKKEEDSNKAMAEVQVLLVTTTQPGVQVFPPTVDLTTGEPTSRSREPRVAATIEIVKGAPTVDLSTVRDPSGVPKPTAATNDEIVEGAHVEVVDIELKATIGTINGVLSKLNENLAGTGSFIQETEGDLSTIGAEQRLLEFAVQP
jgi:hypothetical protein